MQPLLKSSPGPLLKLGLSPWSVMVPRRKTKCRKPEQMYTLSDTRLEWPEEGPLFWSDSNKHQEAEMGPFSESHFRPLLKSCLQPLVRYGTCQETISRRPEQTYTPNDTRMKWPGEGPLFELDLTECRGSECGALFMSGLGPLASHPDLTHSRTFVFCNILFNIQEFLNLSFIL